MEKRLVAPLSAENRLAALISAETRLAAFISAVRSLGALIAAQKRITGLLSTKNRLLALSPAVKRLFAFISVEMRIILLLSAENGLIAFISAKKRFAALITTELRLVAFTSTETRLVVLITALSVAVGLVFGFVEGALVTASRAAADNAVVRFDLSEQDDFIIAAAEAYAGDHDLPLARARIARLQSDQIAARVERLAAGYASQRDLIATQLAGLAVALGSKNTALLALNVVADPIMIAPNAANATAPRPAPQASGAVVGAGQRPAPTTAPPQAAENDDLLRRPERLATPRPTRMAALNLKPNSAKQPSSASGQVVKTIMVSLPDYVGAPVLSIPFNAPPSRCTSASQMPAVVTQTIALCANQVYSPFGVNGNNITIYGDSLGSALIHAPSRSFGLTVNGSNITIAGVHIDADTDSSDLNTWLCLYENCSFKRWESQGAMSYGGGILLDHTTNVAVISSTVSSGAIGVASVHGAGNKIMNNNLSNLNGWGAFLFYSDYNAVVGNTLNNVIRSCMGPDGRTFTSGCESAGVAAVRANSNFFVNNHCEHSSNCIYASGELGYSSNDNKFFDNYCAASPHNCYEITFSDGNQLDYNVATSDPDTGDKCTYPFWISGSTVNFGPHNTWDCKYSAQQALIDSQHATQASTAADGF